jgi:hypothetical protein
MDDESCRLLLAACQAEHDNLLDAFVAALDMLSMRKVRLGEAWREQSFRNLHKITFASWLCDVHAKIISSC